MSCPQCRGIEEFFDQREAERDLRSYRKNGLAGITSVLLEAIRAQGVDGASLLDVGGGVGVVQHELLGAGVSTAVSVDASIAYLAAAKEEAERRGHADRLEQHHGNFVDVAPQIEQADIVTLDKVICCYHDVEQLVRLSSAKAKRIYAVVYPRYNLLFRALPKLAAVYFRLRRTPFRAFVHPTAVVEGLVEGNGLRRTFYRKSGFWQVALFTRAGA